MSREKVGVNSDIWVPGRSIISPIPAGGTGFTSIETPCQIPVSGSGLTGGGRQ